ncbi:MAG: thioredoxin [Anaerolineales bacterium]
MAALTELTDDSFESEVKGSDLPVLVDFGAEWCHPCKQLDPIVEKLAEEWEGKVKVFHLDIDENADSTMEYGVMGVPTLILFKDGEPQERMTGFVPREKIIEKLSPHLSL